MLRVLKVIKKENITEKEKEMFNDINSFTKEILNSIFNYPEIYNNMSGKEFIDLMNYYIIYGYNLKYYDEEIANVLLKNIILILFENYVQNNGLLDKYGSDFISFIKFRFDKEFLDL